MTNKALSIFNQLRPLSVGFDNVFDHFESMFDYDTVNVSNYPPYNIVKTGDNKYDVEVALAGFNKKDISIDVHDGVLTIKGNGGSEVQDDSVQYIYKGIAKRSFEQKFRLEQYVDVKEAKLSNGLLTVSLLREVPEERKPRQITLKTAWLTLG